jgi:GNAT superfamily N-acetyltransferase
MPFSIRESSEDRVQPYFDATFEDFYHDAVHEGSGFAEFTALATLEADGSPVGALHATSYWGGVLIHRLVVKEGYRRGGLGRALLLAALAFGRRHGASLATVETLDYQAPAWYPRHGFTLDFTRKLAGGKRQLHYFSRRLAETDADASADGLGSHRIPAPPAIGGPAAAPPLATPPASGEGSAGAVAPPLPVAAADSEVAISVREVASPPSDEVNTFARSVFNAHAIGAVGSTAGFFLLYFEAVDDVTGELIGAIDAKAYWGMLYVTGLIVSRGWRGQGVGSALLDRALEAGRSGGCTLAVVETFDFQVRGEQPVDGAVSAAERSCAARCGAHKVNAHCASFSVPACSRLTFTSTADGARITCEVAGSTERRCTTTAASCSSVRLSASLRIAPSIRSPVTTPFQRYLIIRASI